MTNNHFLNLLRQALVILNMKIISFMDIAASIQKVANNTFKTYKGYKEYILKIYAEVVWHLICKMEKFQRKDFDNIWMACLGRCGGSLSAAGFWYVENKNKE